MNISFTVSVYNEKTEIEKLLDSLLRNLQLDDEIIVLHTYRDISELDQDWFIDISNICKKYTNTYSNFHFQNNFSEMKNTLNKLANKNFIINLDADEIVRNETLELWKNALQNNTNDLFFVPRINIVDNYTIEDIKEYNWSINQHGWVNWPDYQPRIFKNSQQIKWVGNIHESLTGHKSAVALPADPKLAIIHHKSIQRQRQQNEFYKQI